MASELAIYYTPMHFMWGVKSGATPETYSPKVLGPKKIALLENCPPIKVPPEKCNFMYVGAQLRSQPILRWAIAQLRILSWVAYLKMGLAHLKMG